MDSRCRIELFGGLRVCQGDRVITRFRTQKTAALLAYLAYHGDRRHSREVLIDLLMAGGRLRRRPAQAQRRSLLPAPAARAPGRAGRGVPPDGAAHRLPQPGDRDHGRGGVRSGPAVGGERPQRGGPGAQSEPGGGAVQQRAAARVLRGLDPAPAAAADGDVLPGGPAADRLLGADRRRGPRPGVRAPRPEHGGPEGGSAPRTGAALCGGGTALRSAPPMRRAGAPRRIGRA